MFEFVGVNDAMNVTTTVRRKTNNRFTMDKFIQDGNAVVAVKAPNGNLIRLWVKGAGFVVEKGVVV